MAFPTITVEIALGVDPTVDYLILDDTERGLLDTGRLAPADGVWTDVSAYVQQVTTSRGRQRLLEQYRTGTCTVVVDNDDGRFSPHNLSGPYVAGGVTQLQPERRIRVRATWGGTTYDLFHGFVDAYSPTWTHPQGSRVTITASDAFKVLGRYDPAAESSPVGAGEATGARVARLLDLVSWPDGDRDLATGDSTLQATTLAQNVLTELFLSVDSEMGEVYVDEAGKVVFENRHAIFERARSNVSRASFSDAVAGSEDAPFATFPGTSGDYASTASTFPTGDFELRARVRLDDYTPAAHNTILGLWHTTGNQRGALFRYRQTVELRMSDDGTNPDIATASSVTVASAVGTLTDNTTWAWLRVRYEKNSGSGQYLIRFYASLDDTNDDTAVTWTQVGADRTGTSIGNTFDSTENVAIGAWGSGTSERLAGDVRRWVLYDTLDPTSATTPYYDFDPADAADETDTSWTSTQSATGETWTLNGGDVDLTLYPRVHYFDIEVAPFDADLVKNSVSIARVGGEAQTATDATSIARYFTRTWQRHDLLLESDVECDAYADQIVLTEKDARQRIEGVSLRGLSDDTGRGVWPQILGRRLGDRVTVVRTPENGDALDRQVFIAGVDHAINAGRDWVCRFATADATAYAEPGFFVLDHASLGKLGTNALAAF